MKQFLHQHSSLFGLSSSALVGIIAAAVLRWQFPANAVGAMVAAMVGLLVFPRFFDGLVKTPGDRDDHKSGEPIDFGRYDMAGIDRSSNELESAYLTLKDGAFDPGGRAETLFRQAAEEDR